MACFRTGRSALRGLALTVGAWLLAAAVVSAQGLPKAEEVLDKYIKATGGKEAHEKIKNRVSYGKMDIGGSGIKGTMVMYQAAPAKNAVVIELEGLGKIEQGTDGKIAWEKSALTGTRLLSGEELEAQLRRANFHGDLHWRTLYEKAECTGEEKINDKPAWKVVLTPKKGEPMTQFYDKESGLVVKVAVTINSPMGALPTESFLSDWKKVDGILMPFKVRQTVLVQELTITVDKVEQNVKIPDEKFAIPEDVKKLIDKK